MEQLLQARRPGAGPGCRRETAETRLNRLDRRPLGRWRKQSAPDVAAVPGAWKHEVDAASDRPDVLVEGIHGREAHLHGHKLCRGVFHERQKHQPGVPLTRLRIQPLDVVVAATKHFRSPIAAGQTHVGVLRQGAGFQLLVLVTPAERCAGLLVPANRLLLIVERGSVPHLDEHSYPAHDQVTPAAGPFRPVVTDPDHGIHHLGVVDVGIRRSVPKPFEVPTGVAVRVGLRARKESLLHPAEDRVAFRGAAQVVDRVERDLVVVGGGLNHEVATGPALLELIPGKLGEGRERLGPLCRQPEPTVKQSGPDTKRHREARGVEPPRLAGGARRRVSRAGGRRRPPRGEVCALLGPDFQQVPELRGVSGGDIEGGDKGELSLRRGDPGLVGAVECHSIGGAADGARREGHTGGDGRNCENRRSNQRDSAASARSFPGLHHDSGKYVPIVASGSATASICAESVRTCSSSSSVYRR